MFWNKNKNNKPEKVSAIQINKIGGLKCDNPNCDWIDEAINYKDYEKYIGYKCPKCGEIVLTEKDYKSFQAILKLIKILNFILPKRVPKENDSEMKLEFDGTGKLKTTIKSK